MQCVRVVQLNCVKVQFGCNLQERLKGRSSHNGEFSVMSRDSLKGNRQGASSFVLCRESVLCKHEFSHWRVVMRETETQLSKLNELN